MCTPAYHGLRVHDSRMRPNLSQLLSWLSLAKSAKREKREGCTLLTVETKVNGDKKSTNERRPSLVGSSDLSRRYNRFLFCLGCYRRPSTKYFFLTVHLCINLFVLTAQQAGKAAELGRLSLVMCLGYNFGQSL
jgi:hypothetical protein